LGSIFKSWVYPFGPYLPKGFQQNLWLSLTRSLEKSLAHQIERKCGI
jgi:hypothetical protein